MHRLVKDFGEFNVTWMRSPGLFEFKIFVVEMF